MNYVIPGPGRYISEDLAPLQGSLTFAWLTIIRIAQPIVGASTKLVSLSLFPFPRAEELFTQTDVVRKSESLISGRSLVSLKFTPLINFEIQFLLDHTGLMGGDRVPRASFPLYDSVKVTCARLMCPRTLK